jgi:16S rRNA (cytosine967-C5)-methyltransferase
VTRQARAPGARDIAAKVLVRVERDGAFAAAALEAELEAAVQTDPRDRALATELAYGTLRTLPWLLTRIDRYAPRGTGRLDARVRAQLTLAAYQLYFTRVPAFAAVHEAVARVRAERGEKLAAFTNAVLRKVARDAAAPTAPDRQEAIVASTPAWLVGSLERALTAEGARAFLASGAEPPPVVLRVERAGEREEWLAKLRAHAPAATFEAGPASPRAILVRGAGRPQDLPGWAAGAWTVQEEGSQLVALAPGARPGETVLDACAGRGNKTSVLARAVQPGGAVDACDASPSKLDRLVHELGRLGLAPRDTYAVDWTVGSGEVTGTYDRVLVDAPCSGIGTLRRRPDILRRREPTDVAALAHTQIAIASRAAAHVRPGGAFVYAVCSVLREEAEDVVDALLHLRPELTPAPFDSPELHALGEISAAIRLLPQLHGTDGYFVAMFRRAAAT